MSDKSPEKSSTSPQEPIRATSFLDDDLEISYDSPRDRVFGILKWSIIVLGLGAVLYFGGDLLHSYWVEDLQRDVKVKDQMIQELKNSTHEIGQGVITFSAVVQQVSSSPKGKAYLIMDEMGQPWFAMSALDYKRGDKVTVELMFSDLKKPAKVTLKRKTTPTVSVQQKLTPKTETHSSSAAPTKPPQGSSVPAPAPADSHSKH